MITINKAENRAVKWSKQANIAYFDNFELYEYLRKEHQIIAEPIGSLPSLPKQNKQLGYPFTLSMLETKYLLEK